MKGKGSQMANWQEDARFVGAFIRGGDWEVGLRVARSVTVDKGTAHRLPKNLGRERVSMTEFAEEAGLSQPTVAKYLAAWEWAADAGKVDLSAELASDDEYDWETAGLTQSEWAEFYQVACENPPPWNPQGKPLEPRKSPDRHVAQEHVVTDRTVRDYIKAKPEVVADAIKEDPRVELSATEAIEAREAQRAREKATITDRTAPKEPMQDATSLFIKLSAAKRNLQDSLGLALDIRGHLEEATRAHVFESVAQLRGLVDAIESAANGESIDAELAKLLDEGAR